MPVHVSLATWLTAHMLSFGRYGTTASDRLVDMEAVEQLQAMGYERRLCAEALRQVIAPPTVM